MLLNLHGRTDHALHDRRSDLLRLLLLVNSLNLLLLLLLRLLNLNLLLLLLLLLNLLQLHLLHGLLLNDLKLLSLLLILLLLDRAWSRRDDDRTSTHLTFLLDLDLLLLRLIDDDCRGMSGPHNVDLLSLQVHDRGHLLLLACRNLNQLSANLLGHHRNLLLLLRHCHRHHLLLLLLLLRLLRNSGTNRSQLPELRELVRLKPVRRRRDGQSRRRLNRRLRRGKRLELSLLRMHRGRVRAGNRFDDSHQNASLRAVALSLDGDEADEGFEGPVGSRDCVAGDLAVAGYGVETLECADEEVDVVQRKVRDELVVDRALVREEAGDEGLVRFDLAEFVEDVE